MPAQSAGGGFSGPPHPNAVPVDLGTHELESTSSYTFATPPVGMLLIVTCVDMCSTTDTSGDLVFFRDQSTSHAFFVRRFTASDNIWDQWSGFEVFYHGDALTIEHEELGSYLDFKASGWFMPDPYKGVPPH